MTKTFVALAMSAAVALPAQADEVADLKRQLAELQARIEVLERERVVPGAPAAIAAAAQPGAPPAAVNGNAPAGPKTDTGKPDAQLSVGGYIRAAAIGSSRGAGSNSLGDELLIPSLIPLDGAEYGDNKVKFTARESRLNVKSHRSTPYGPLTTLFEIDFYGTAAATDTGSSSHGARIRQAWGTLGKLGAGQSWSNLMNLAAYPDITDFSPPQGSLGPVRQTGVRWTAPLENGYWAVSLENPDLFVSGTQVPNPDSDEVPDVTAKIHRRLGRLEYELGLLARYISDSAAGAEGESAYGVALSGVLPLGGDDIRFQLVHGDGAGRYLGGFSALTDAVQVGSELRTIETLSGYLSYRHRWTASLRSSLLYSWIDARNPALGEPELPHQLLKHFWSGHANLIWSPWPAVDLAAEYVHARRQVESGLTGELDRVIFSAKYAF